MYIYIYIYIYIYMYIYICSYVFICLFLKILKLCTYLSNIMLSQFILLVLAVILLKHSNFF